MEYAIVTLAIGNTSQKMLTLVKPFFKAYSRKIGADFIVIDKSIINGYASHLEKFQIYNILEKYSRVAYLDVDIIIQEHTPNIFDEVPFDKIGIVYDNSDNNIRSLNRVREIQNVQRTLGDVNWIEGYANSGVIVLSDMHKKIFTQPELRYKIQSGFKDQTLINYNIHKHGFELHKLDKKFNGMEINGFSSRDKNPKTNRNGRNKDDAFCMHFANEGNKLIQMYETIDRLKINDGELKRDVDTAMRDIGQFINSQKARELAIQNKKEETDTYSNARKKRIAKPNPIQDINNPHELKLFYDISELGWAMYLAAHLKYLDKKGERVGVICQKSREVLYRDCTEIILPYPKLFIDKFGGLPSDGNHLFDHRTNQRIKDHVVLSKPFKRSYPKFNIITKYSKFEHERIFEPYQHSFEMELFCKEVFKDKSVIIVFPRHRTSKFRCRNIPRGGWINIIRSLCRSFPEAIIASIGAVNGAYDINVSEKNYRNLVNHNNDETLDILVALCNTKQAIATIGNQSGTVKIALLCGTPTYIFGDEKDRHINHENWSKTDSGFWESKLTSEGYEIPNFHGMIKDIISFVGRKYYLFKQGLVKIEREVYKKEIRRIVKVPPPTSSIRSSVGVPTSNIITAR